MKLLGSVIANTINFNCLFQGEIRFASLVSPAIREDYEFRYQL
ncbi:hypothetical protein S1OALGB6SA_1258 [Olavius algarvensis spirochete endosymbiont]|nr:MAG: hypothetical protein [Olavius algarvensis spirochete endosymbiont]VDB00183.1 hypothetical protein S1OALGB6SA_1258 [Olavius algarvensis spirochete endosymbiont]